jgi:hypothetical protein
MTFKRLLASAGLFGFLLLASPAAGQSSGGGAVAPTASAPTAEPSVAAPAAETAPAAEPAQDETPTTPEGEEQPPAEQPDGEQPPSEEGGPVAERPQGGVGAQTSGGLPQTGFEVFALTSIGLGLLLAGAALWPTSSWPPPRVRLTRLTERR